MVVVALNKEDRVGDVNAVLDVGGLDVQFHPARVGARTLHLLMWYTGHPFFSGRRRHTSFSRDWSSDVCSSDLAGAGWSRRAARSAGPIPVRPRRRGGCGPPSRRYRPGHAARAPGRRSGPRQVRRCRRRPPRRAAAAAGRSGPALCTLPEECDVPDVHREAALRSEPLHQVGDQPGGLLHHVTATAADKVQVFILGRVVRRGAVVKVGVPDQAELLEQLQGAVDRGDVDRRCGALHLGGQPVRRRVAQPAHRVQHELALRGQAVAPCAQFALELGAGHQPMICRWVGSVPWANGWWGCWAPGSPTRRRRWSGPTTSACCAATAASSRRWSGTATWCGWTRTWGGWPPRPPGSTCPPPTWTRGGRWPARWSGPGAGRARRSCA